MNKIQVAKTQCTKPANQPVTMTRLMNDDLAALQTESFSDRKTFFANPKVRQSIEVPSSCLVSGDFSNPFIDFNTLRVGIPFVHLYIDVLKYWQGQSLRYTCRTRAGDVFFCVYIDLVESS